MKSKNLIEMTGIALLAGIIPAPANAYIDPGTGGLIVQIIAGGAAGLLVIVRLYWSRIKAFFGKVPAEPNSDDEKK